MTDKEIIRSLLRANGYGSPTLAKRLGYKNNSGVTEALRRVYALRLDTFYAFITALGGEIIVTHHGNEYPVKFEEVEK